MEGVTKAVSGYMGGSSANPGYEQVCTGRTGHIEVVQVTFDHSVTTLKEILEVFFTIHDPTSLDRQGADAGTQYRSVIFYSTAEQKQVAESTIAELNGAKIWSVPIVTEIRPAAIFYSAEAYHQDYYANNPNQPYCQAVVVPKVAKFRQKFAKKMKR
jgi:methionine-S-sulfoxide reductase